MRAIRACAAVVAALLTSPAWGQPLCGPREAIIDALASEYQEQPVGQGLSRQGPVVSIYANPETGTWSAIAEFPNGSACIMEEEWQIVAPVMGRPS